MTLNTESFVDLKRRIAQRRAALLKENGRLIYPKAGTDWFPNNREQALCESYVVLFVAELETYLEHTVSCALNLYQIGFQASIFAQAKPGSDYIRAVNEKRNAWERNNNTNWSRRSEFILFIGLKKADFPERLWDDIEFIAAERGGIVHKSVGLRTINDPR